MKTFTLQGKITGHTLGGYDKDGAHLDSILTILDRDSEIQLDGNIRMDTKFTITIEPISEAV